MIKIRPKLDALLEKGSTLNRARAFLEELVAEYGTNDTGRFFRFVLARSFCEFEWPAIQAIHRRSKEKALPRSAIARVAEYSSKLVDALNKVNAASSARLPTGKELFSQQQITTVVDVKDAARRLLRQFSIKGSRGHPVLEKRIYTVSALLPYLRWRKIAGRGDGSEPADTGAWSWLTKWDDHFGRIHVLDQAWLGRRLCAGGITPDDFADRARFWVASSKKQDKAHSETVLRWWTNISKKKDNRETILDFGAAFIAWRRQLFKKPIFVGDVGSTAPLEGVEVDFAASAVKTLAHHTEVSEQSILDRWAQIHL